MEKGNWLVLVIITLVLSICVVGSFALYPVWLAYHRVSLEQSKSFTDSHNNMLETYVLEYSRLDTKIVSDPESKPQYEAQQKALIEQMCQIKSTMGIGTINPDIVRFLATHGGCS